MAFIVNQPLAPTQGEIWEFTVRAYDVHTMTAFINRIRLCPRKIAPADPMLEPTCYAALGQFRSRWRAGVIPYLHNSYRVNTYSISRLSGYEILPPGNRMRLEYDQRRDLTGDPIADRGTRAGDQTSNFVTAGVYWDTELINANTRAMMRLSPLVDADIDGANLTPAFLALLTAGTNLLTPNWMDNVNNTRWRPVVFSSATLAKNTNPKLAPELFDYCASWILSATVGTQVGSQITRKNRSGV